MSSVLALLPDPRAPHREDHVVHFSGLTWADYLRLLELRGDRSGPRMTYREGELRIVSPSVHHERVKSTLGSLVETWCLVNGIEFQRLGSWTIKEEAVQRGVEPDECFLFGDDPDPARPDLALEVIWSSGGTEKLDVYRLLGVREVWFWERGAIRAFVLENAAYVEVEESACLPGVDLAQLASFADRPTTSAAVREYRVAITRESPA